MKNNQTYIGYTSDLKNRIDEHTQGKVFTTKKYLPISLIYYECYVSEQDAKHREYMLKRFGGGYRQLKKRLLHTLKKF